VYPKGFLILLLVGIVGCKSSTSPAPITAQEQEVAMAQLENFVLAGKAIKAGSNHSGAVWVETSTGQILITKKGRTDFHEFVKKNAPKPIDFYIE
jgi:hypothetical protein